MIPIIRLANAEDCSAVQSVVEAAYAPYVARIGRRPAPMNNDYPALVRDGRVHVLENDGLIQGVLVLIPEKDTLLLDNIAVTPRAQNAGLGRTLLEFAEQSALDSGYNSILLYTNQAMTENIAWYLRKGFVETCRVEEKGLRRVYMRKDLD